MTHARVFRRRASTTGTLKDKGGNTSKLAQKVRDVFPEKMG